MQSQTGCELFFLLVLLQIDPISSPIFMFGFWRNETTKDLFLLFTQSKTINLFMKDFWGNHKIINRKEKKLP